MVLPDETSEMRESSGLCNNLDKDLKRFNEPVYLRLLLTSKSSVVGEVNGADI